MATRHVVRGAGGVRLAAWEYDAGAARRSTPAAASAVDPVSVPAAEAVPVAVGAPVPVPVGAVGAAGAGAHGSSGAAEPGQPAGGRSLGGEPRPGVLLLHGPLGRASHWMPTARRLAPRYRAIALDQRGHGGSAKPSGPYTPEAHVLDAIATVEQLGLAPAVLVGHSMGALTAWQCAVRRPDLVAAVVICDMRASAPGEGARRACADWLASWPLPFRSLADARRWFGAEDPRADPPGPVRGAYFAGALSRRRDGWRPVYEPAHVLAAVDPWVRDAHWDELALVGCPALVVRGPGGMLGRAEAQEMVRVLPRGRYAEIADAGHLLPWDQPDAWAREVERFASDALAGR